MEDDRLDPTRARLGGEKLAAVIPEGSGLPTDAAVTFDPAAVNLYADSWLLQERA